MLAALPKITRTLRLVIKSHRRQLRVVRFLVTASHIVIS